MSISTDYLKIINKISESWFIPSIREIIIPSLDKDNKNSNFAAIILEDDSIGIFFINLSDDIKNSILKRDYKDLQSIDPSIIAQKFSSKNLVEKSIAMGCINAISQFYFKKIKYQFNYTTNSLGLLNIEESDTIGMVGFFPPLVKLIENKGNKLIIIEKKEEFIKSYKNWEVTLNPKQLESCNKVLITSTTILNESIDEILNYCLSAQKISIIGPTAGFLPDPLFKRNIDVIGGTQVHNVDLFTKAIKNNLRWGSTVKKYTIEKKKYDGFEIFV